MNIELNAIHESVQEVLHQADLVVRRSFGRHLNFSKKLSIQPATDIVTEVDVVIENLLKQELARILPGAGFIGEETENCVAQNYNWIVDPLDGTLNFANKIPIFCISVALWQDNTPLYGVVSLPMQNEMVHSIVGTGIFVNGLPAGRKKRPGVPELSLLTHVGSSESKAAVCNSIIGDIPFPRYYGSTAFHAVITALGRADCAIIVNNALWDIAAAVAIASEAGLACCYISPVPDLMDLAHKNYRHTLVIGEATLASRVAARVQQALARTLP